MVLLKLSRLQTRDLVCNSLDITHEELDFILNHIGALKTTQELKQFYEKGEITNEKFSKFTIQGVIRSFYDVPVPTFQKLRFLEEDI
jgi:hypothetical protein